MTSARIDDYLRQLEAALLRHGCETVRIVHEARDHLIDAVEGGLRRGLSAEDAEREAFERFGAPEVVAAHVAQERGPVMTRLRAMVDTVWQRKWWVVAPTVLTAVVTTALSFYFLPTRYRSQSVIQVVSARVPDDYVQEIAAERRNARLQRISESVLSRQQLERIIDEFGLYAAERQTEPLDDVIEEMRRRDIKVSVSSRVEDPDVAGLSVSFESPDPALAMKIAERLATVFIRESLEERENMVAATTTFIESQIADLRRRIIDYEHKLDALRAESAGRPLSRADLLPYEVLQGHYKELLVKAEAVRVSANRERRQIGEQFKMIEAPRLAERPIGPNRAGVSLIGALGGLAIGLLAVVAGRKSRRDS